MHHRAPAARHSEQVTRNFPPAGLHGTDPLAPFDADHFLAAAGVENSRYFDSGNFECSGIIQKPVIIAE